jgi:hypothetical protein
MRSFAALRTTEREMLERVDLCSAQAACDAAQTLLKTAWVEMPG